MAHFILVLILSLLAIQNPEIAPKNHNPLIIDADTANEVDDLFALARVLKDPSVNLIGITSAQFHTSPLASDSSVLESHILNERLAALTDREDVPVKMGSNFPMENKENPQRSEASDFIIQKAKELAKGEKLDLVILGSCTNVASAILQAPEIIPMIRVHYLGFWHDPETNFYNKKEFNSGNDPLAVDVLLDMEGLDLTIMTATTSQNLVFKKDKMLDELAGKSELGDFLSDRWLNFERWWTKEDPKKEFWIMWDVAIIEALILPELSEVEYFQTPPENTSRKIKIHAWIDSEAMEKDFWQILSR